MPLGQSNQRANTMGSPTNAQILVVEDEPLVRSYVAELLRDQGYDAVEAENADTAMELLKSDEFNLIVTDIEMPGTLNGIELAWASEARNPHLPVVVMSGRMLPRRSELPTGARFVAKPCAPEALLLVITDALRRI